VLNGGRLIETARLTFNFGTGGYRWREVKKGEKPTRNAGFLRA
jgi:hypothetical protein